MVITGLVCLLVGATVVFVIGKTLLKTRAQSIIEEAAKEAEVIKKNKLLEVKEKFLHLKADMEKQANTRNVKLQSAEAKAKQRELQLNQQQQELQRKKAESDAIRANLDTQIEIVERKKPNWNVCIRPRLNVWNIFRDFRQKKRKKSLSNR